MKLITNLINPNNRISKRCVANFFHSSLIYLPVNQQHFLYRRNTDINTRADNNNTTGINHNDNRNKKINNDHCNDIDPDLEVIFNKPFKFKTMKEFDTYIDNKLSCNICEYTLSTLMYDVSKSKFKLSDKHIDNVSNLIKEIKLTETKSLCKMFYSLTSCHKVNDSILNILRILTGKLQFELYQPLNSQGVTTILCCLKDMTSDQIEVRQLLQALIPHIKKCNPVFTYQNIGNILYGLQGMSSDNVEVCDMLEALIPHIQKCKDKFKSRSIAMALYGLQGMNTNCIVVCQLLQVLIPHIKTSEDMFTSQGIGNVLYGLQGMSSDNVQVCDILEALIPHIKSQSQYFKAQTYEQCFFALAYLFSINNNSTLILIDYLIKQLETYLNNSNSTNDKLSADDIYTLERSLNIFQFKQHHIPNGFNNQSIELIKNQIAILIKKTYYPVIYTSHCEKQIFAIIKQILENKEGIKIYNNTYKDGFELDILIIIYNNTNTKNKKDPEGYNGYKSINIEIDGPRHDISNKRSFIKIRDELLTTKYNIVIKRIPLLINNIYQKPHELEAEVIEILRDLNLI